MTASDDGLRTIDRAKANEQTHDHFKNLRELPWTPGLAMFVWKNVLCLLGNINAMTDPMNFADAVDCLVQCHNQLVKIRSNQGVSLDNMSTPAPPEETPPLYAFFTWVLQVGARGCIHGSRSGWQRAWLIAHGRHRLHLRRPASETIDSDRGVRTRTACCAA